MVRAPESAKSAGGEKERMKRLRASSDSCLIRLATNSSAKHTDKSRHQASPPGAEYVSPGRKPWVRCGDRSSPLGTSQAAGLLAMACLILILAAPACSKQKNAAAATGDTASVASASASPANTPDSAAPPAFDFEQDDFEVTPSEGRFPIHNIIAKFPGSKDGIVVIASHYDTNWPLRNIAYVGANDGGSSSALLLEIANQIRGKKLDGYSIWLLWDDGEESMKLPWDDPESLYGVRHLTQKWQDDGTLKRVKAFVLEDMIGDADLNIERDTGSTPWLEDLVYQAATHTGYQSHFFAREMPVEDDHQAFLQRGVPAVDIIDFSYGYNDVFHHTAEDTIDKLSPKSLAIVGTVTLETVRLLNQR